MGAKTVAGSKANWMGEEMGREIRRNEKKKEQEEEQIEEKEKDTTKLTSLSSFTQNEKETCIHVKNKTGAKQNEQTIIINK